MRHIPVLLNEVIETLNPQNGCVYVSRETTDKRTKFVEKICEMFDFSIAIKK